jgi:UDP-N-acetylmuramate--alanine ligase
MLKAIVETVIIEVNSLPGMTPATAIFHQAALKNLKPFEFIDLIISSGFDRSKKKASYESL